MAIDVGSINRLQILTFPKKSAEVKRMTQVSPSQYPCVGKGHLEAGLTVTGGQL